MVLLLLMDISRYSECAFSHARVLVTIFRTQNEDIIFVMVHL